MLVAAAYGRGGGVNPKQLVVGSSYRVGSLTPLLAEMKQPDPMAVIRTVKHIPPGGAFKVDAMEVVYLDTWYKVRAISPQKKVIGVGYINSKALENQPLTPYGVTTIKASRAVPKPAAVKPVDSRPYKVIFSKPVNYRSPGANRTINRENVSVHLKKDLTEEELKAVAKEIVGTLDGRDAVSISFYLPDSQTDGPFTAGKAVWAPNGKWEDAATEDDKKLTLEYGGALEKLSKSDILDLPLEQKQAVFKALMKIDEEGTDRSLTRAAIATKHKLKISQVKKIKVEGIYKNWPMR